MRAAFLAALALAAAAPFAEAHAAPKAGAVLKVGFPRGNPFARRLPDLQIVEAKSQKLVASLRAREWTRQMATYETVLPTGKTYVLSWNAKGAEAPFAEVPVADGAEGTVTFRIPYVPKLKPAIKGETMAAVTPRR